MATHDYNLANQDGASFRSDLNNALAAIVSNNSSSTAPATTFAHQIWVDTTANVIKQRNAANDAWVELWRIDGGFNAKTFSSNVTLNAQSDLRFADSDSSNWVAFQAPATVSSNVTWTLPSADGTADQALTTNGSGVLSWADAGGVTDNITEGNTSAEVVDTGSDGHFKVVTEGTEALRVDASRRLLVGTNSARANFNNSTATARFQVEGTDFNTSSIALARNSADGNAGALMLAKSRSGSVGGNTVVQSNDLLGQILFEGNDGSEFVVGANIYAQVDGTPGANDMPTRLVFETTADGASGTTERMRIQSDGSVVCTGNIFTGTSSALLTDTIFSRSQDNSDANSKIVLRPRNAVGGSSIQAEVTVSGLFKFNSGYGSAATAYGVRAWVNFNGTGTVAIRASGNVSSITDNGTGDYTVNFTTSMPDRNYAFVMSALDDSGADRTVIAGGDASGTTPQAGSFRFNTFKSNDASMRDADNANVAIFR